MHQDRRGYWYRSKREGGRVVREYMGRGEVAMRGARLEALDAQRFDEERREERARLEEAQAQARAVDAPVVRLGALADGVMRQVLEAGGYHLHARSQWRKKRGEPRSNPMTDKAIQKSLQAKSPKLSDAEHNALRERARTDPEAARIYLDNAEAEGAGDWFLRLNDVAHQAQHSLINSLEGTDEIFKAMCARRMQHIRRDLGGDNPTPLERMLIERIAVCWLHVHIVEMTVAQRSATMTLPVAEYQQKRLDKAHKRHLSAIKALAQVRRMALPAPPVLMVGSVTGPVNVGGHQVNVATGGKAQSKAVERATSPVAARSGFGR